MRAAWLVRTSSFYFHKARTLRHTSALLKYNSRSLRHRNERAQFMIPFIKEIKNLFPRALLSFISTREFLRTPEKCEMNILWLVLLRTSLVFLKIPGEFASFSWDAWSNAPLFPGYGGAGLSTD